SSLRSKLPALAWPDRTHSSPGSVANKEQPASATGPSAYQILPANRKKSAAVRSARFVPQSPAPPVLVAMPDCYSPETPSESPEYFSTPLEGPALPESPAPSPRLPPAPKIFLYQT